MPKNVFFIFQSVCEYFILYETPLIHSATATYFNYILLFKSLVSLRVTALYLNTC